MTTIDGRDITALVRASRERMLGVLHRLHAERGPGCLTWESYSIPAHGGGRMAGEGCRAHEIFISASARS